MAKTEKITQPSFGSNEVGAETNDSHLTGVSSGTDTQLKIAAKGGNNKHTKNVNDDEEVVKNPNDEEEFLQAYETDE